MINDGRVQRYAEVIDDLTSPTLIRDWAKWLDDVAEAVSDAANAELAELRAKVARVEALLGNWESMKGAPEAEAWTHYVAERVRNALSGDYSSEASAAS